MSYEDAERRFFGLDHHEEEDHPPPPTRRKARLVKTSAVNKPTQPPPVILPYALRSFEVDDFVTFGRDELFTDLDRIKRDLHIT